MKPSGQVKSNSLTWHNKQNKYIVKLLIYLSASASLIFVHHFMPTHKFLFSNRYHILRVLAGLPGAARGFYGFPHVILATLDVQFITFDVENYGYSL